MKKCMIGIGMLLAIVAIAVIVLFVTHNDWEAMWEGQNYFYSEDAEPEGVVSGGAQFAYDKERYRKIKLEVNSQIIGSDGTVRIMDVNGKVLKEWEMSGQDVWEGELEPDLVKEMDTIEMVMNEKKCDGNCHFILYGKKKLSVIIRNLFEE